METAETRPPSFEPAPLGNRRAAKHFPYATFTPAELEEVGALEDEIRDACPVDSPSVEPAISVLAGLLWRRDKLFAYVNDNGITRGRADRATLNPTLEALAVIDRQILEAMRQLAMLPKAAADLGHKLAKTRRVRHEFNLDNLTDDERRTLEALMAKAEKR